MAVSSNKGTKPEDYNGRGFIKGSKSHTIVSERIKLLHMKVHLEKLAVQIKLPEETFVKLFVNTARVRDSLGKKAGFQLPHYTDGERRTGFKFLKLDDWKRYSADAAAAAAPDIEAALAALRHMHDCEVNKAKATAANEDDEEQFSSDAALQQAINESKTEDDEEQFSAALQQAINESKTEAAQREELRAKEAVASAHAQSAGPAPHWRPRYKGDTGKRKANP